MSAPNVHIRLIRLAKEGNPVSCELTHAEFHGLQAVLSSTALESPTLLDDYQASAIRKMLGAMSFVCERETAPAPAQRIHLGELLVDPSTGDPAMCSHGVWFDRGFGHDCDEHKTREKARA